MPPTGTNTYSPGAELIINGTFTGTEAPWVLGTDVTFNAESDKVTSTYNGGDPTLYTDITTVSGTGYRITFTISSANAPVSVYFSSNSTPEWGTFGNGTHSIAFTADYDGVDTITFGDDNYTVGDTWTLDDVSITSVFGNPALKVIGYDGST